MALKTRIRKILRQSSRREVISLLLYPVVLLIVMPIAWGKSLLACKVLLNGKWECYGGCHPHRSFQHFWTRTQWYNLNKYGRKGCSQSLGSGDYPLSRFFFVALLGHYIYSFAGAASVLLAGLFWLLSHAIFLVDIENTGVWGYYLLLIISTGSFAMIFARQNYSILGWMWVPLIFHFAMQGEIILLILFLMLTSLFSFTVVFFVSLFMIILSFQLGDILIVYALIPVIISWLVSILNSHNYSIGNVLTTFQNTLKLIGASSVNLKYLRRGDKSFKSISFLYFAISNTSLIVGIYFINDYFPLLLMISLFLLLLNRLAVRIADDQTIIMLLMMTAFLELIKGDSSFVLLFFYWISVSPPAALILLRQMKSESNLYIVPDVHEPFDHSTILNDLSRFIAPVEDASKVLWAFEDPQDDYSKIFDGFRTTLEPLMWAAQSRSILVMPNWYAIAENNYVGACNFWGRDKRRIIENMELWGCNYVIYHLDESELLSQELLSEFTILKEFRWGNYLNAFGNYRPWPDQYISPKFLLLKRVGSRYNKTQLQP
jgi:hypothetical protein